MHSALYCKFHLNVWIQLFCPHFLHRLWKSKSPNKGMSVPPSWSCVLERKMGIPKREHFSFFMHPYILKLVLTKMHSIRSAPATSRKKDPVKAVNQEKSTGSPHVSPNTKWYSEWRCQDVSVFCELIFWHNASSPSLWVKREAVMLQQAG